MKLTRFLFYISILSFVIYVSGCAKAGVAIVENDPVITSVYPASAKGGDTVTAHGKNLPTDISNIRISVNDKSADIIKATADSIQAIVPELAGSGKVTLTVGAEKFIGPEFEYTYQVIVTTVAGNGSVGTSDGNGDNVSFNCPWGIAADDNDNLFIADCYNRLIRKISSVDSSVSTFPISNSIEFYSPYNIAVDPATNNLFVTDFNKHVMKMDPAGNAEVIYIDSMAMAGIAVSPDSKSLFVGNNTLGTITKMNLDGTNASVLTSALITPRNLMFNNKGDLFVAAYPGPIYKLASNGTASAAVQEEPDFQGWEFTTDTVGNFFLADHFSNCIRMIDKNGKAMIIAGSGDAEDKDGIGLEASFDGPQGITIDSHGSLYVTTFNYDTNGGNKVRKIVLR